MNKEVLNRLANLLDTVPDISTNEETGIPEGFSMNHFFHYLDDDLYTNNLQECGTPSCIAGHLMFMLNKFPKHRSNIDFCAELCDLSIEEARNLFLPTTNRFTVKSPWDIKAKEAAKIIRNLVETGKVNWEIVCGKEIE